MRGRHVGWYLQSSDQGSLIVVMLPASTPGVLDPSGKATVQSVRVHFWQFVSGWNQKNPTAIISRDASDSVRNVSSVDVLPLKASKQKVD